MTTYLTTLLDKYLKPVINTRLALHFKQKTEFKSIDKVPVPGPGASKDPLALFIKEQNMTFEEIICLLIALAPHLKSDFLDDVIRSFFDQPTDFYLIGGVRGKQFRGFIPTGETLLFVLAGDNLEKRLNAQKLFGEDHYFARKRVLWLEDAPSGEPAMSGKIMMSPEYLDSLTIGKISRPKFGINFPARLIETEREWKDLVLNDHTMQQLGDLQNWVLHGNTLLNEWNMKRIIKPGYRVLFYGSPGTGKTLAATLLGKYTGKEVYKIDLSTIVSKFIGETEKNLSNLFTTAESHEWILFFDEADALFGKRTGVRDAHDKYANQEVSYLLQRVETYPGLVILASNFRDNMDEAFIRRFQSVIYFPKPHRDERLKIWENSLPSQLKLDATVKLKEIAGQYELTGSNIINIVQQVCLKALASKGMTVSQVMVTESIRKELSKEGKML
jgi:hypothetical protein